jgi:hypothetical protein
LVLDFFKTPFGDRRGWINHLGTCPVRFVGSEGWVETGDSGGIDVHPAGLSARSCPIEISKDRISPLNERFPHTSETVRQRSGEPEDEEDVGDQLKIVREGRIERLFDFVPFTGRAGIDPPLGGWCHVDQVIHCKS